MSIFDYGTQDIELVPLLQEHAAMIHVYASKPAVKKYIGWPLMHSPTETAEYVRTLVARHDAGSHIYASVVEKHSGRVVGTGILFGFDKAANHGELGYVFDDTVWGKGYGTQLVRVMSEFAFAELKLRKLFARVVSVNVGSARVLERNGFTLEAELKDYYYMDDTFLSCRYYSRYAPNADR
jgi:ribosomal-protein-alanine N-acetyltransferase